MLDCGMHMGFNDSVRLILHVGDKLATGLGVLDTEMYRGLPPRLFLPTQFHDFSIHCVPNLHSLSTFKVF